MGDLTGWQVNSHFATNCSEIPTVFECISFGSCVSNGATSFNSFELTSYPVLGNGNYSFTTSFYNDTECTVQNRSPMVTSESANTTFSCTSSDGDDLHYGKKQKMSLLPDRSFPISPFPGVVENLFGDSSCLSSSSINQFTVFNPSTCFVGTPSDDETNSPILSYQYSCGGQGQGEGGNPVLVSYTSGHCVGPFTTTPFNTTCQYDAETSFHKIYSCGATAITISISSNRRRL